SVGNWHRLFFRDLRHAGVLKPIEEGGTNEPVFARKGGTAESSHRPESQAETVVVAGSGADTPPGTAHPPGPDRPGAGGTRAPAATQSDRTARRRSEASERWIEPATEDGPPSYTVYRPDSGDVIVPARPARRSESTSSPR